MRVAGEGRGLHGALSRLVAAGMLPPMAVVLAIGVLELLLDDLDLFGLFGLLPHVGDLFLLVLLTFLSLGPLARGCMVL